MPLNFNVAHIGGTLTRSPEVKYTPKGTAVCEISLAVNHVYKTGDGEKREEVMFLDCEAWGRTAEVIGEYCDKGHTIMVEGRLKQDHWEDKQTGQKRSKIKLNIEKFHFVSKPHNGEEDESQERQQKRPSGGGYQKRPPAQQRQPPPRDPDLDAPADDDDVPF